jgi:hypothetical protein
MGGLTTAGPHAAPLGSAAARPCPGAGAAHHHGAGFSLVRRAVIRRSPKYRTSGEPRNGRDRTARLVATQAVWVDELAPAVFAYCTAGISVLPVVLVKNPVYLPRLNLLHTSPTDPVESRAIAAVATPWATRAVSHWIP